MQQQKIGKNIRHLMMPKIRIFELVFFFSQFCHAHPTVLLTMFCPDKMADKMADLNWLAI